MYECITMWSISTTTFTLNMRHTHTLTLTYLEHPLVEVREGENEEIESSDLLFEVSDVSYCGKGYHILSSQERDWQLSVEREGSEGGEGKREREVECVYDRGERECVCVCV